MENYLCYFSTKTYVVDTKMDLLNETVLLKTNSTHINLLIRENSQSLRHATLLNLTTTAYKMIFPRNAILVALLHNGFISSTI